MEAENIAFDEIYFSKFDLNMENGKIELPYKNTTRVIKKIKIGVDIFYIVINYNITDIFKNVLDTTLYDLFLIEEDKQINIHLNDKFSFSKQKHLDIYLNDLLDYDNQYITEKPLEGFGYRVVINIKKSIIDSAQQYKEDEIKNSVIIVAFISLILSLIISSILARVLTQFNKKAVKIIETGKYIHGGEFYEFMNILNNLEIQYSKIEIANRELKNLLHSFSLHVIASKMDLKGKITYVSDAFCEVSGYPREELIGKIHKTMVHPDMPKDSFKDLWETIKTGKNWQGDIKNITKDGNFYWVNAIISPYYDEYNTIIGFNTIRHNITARKEVEYLSENLEKEVAQRTQELQEANIQISKSLNFASLIQETFNYDKDIIQNVFEDSFVVLKQRDAVGGDIVLFERLTPEDEYLVFIIDCTSHGVPGAFVTMIVKTLQRQIVYDIIKYNQTISPAKILSIFNKEIKDLLNQNREDSLSNVGFDGQILYYNKNDNLIKFASARNDILIYQDDTLKRFRGDRHSVGYKDSDENFKFKEHTIEIKDEMSIYLYSDGYTDQLSDSQRPMPYGTKKLIRKIQQIKDESMERQREILFDELDIHQGDYEQNDDISFVGLKIKK